MTLAEPELRIAYISLRLVEQDFYLMLMPPGQFF
jgi:hypothetical protein